MQRWFAIFVVILALSGGVAYTVHQSPAMHGVRMVCVDSHTVSSADDLGDVSVRDVCTSYEPRSYVRLPWLRERAAENR